MISSLIISGIGIIGVGVLWVKKQYLSEKEKILDFDIRFYDDQHHSTLLLSTPIKLDQEHIDDFETGFVNLSRCKIFIQFMNDCGVYFMELYDLDSTSALNEQRLKIN